VAEQYRRTLRRADEGQRLGGDPLHQRDRIGVASDHLGHLPIEHRNLVTAGKGSGNVPSPCPSRTPVAPLGRKSANCIVLAPQTTSKRPSPGPGRSWMMGHPMAATEPLRAEDLDPDPIRQFHAWWQAAERAGLPAPEAAAVATATPDGRPSCRMVLVKSVDARGFVFYTNYDSRKGRELAVNPHAALLFHWEALGRQVRVEGPVTRTSREETTAYAHSRDRSSQLSALASEQSRPVADRATLERRIAELEATYSDGPLPVSETWGGVRLSPDRFEFWQGGPARLHDRFAYEDAAEGWSVVRLQP
jgi:pyridoxamine 5'-phosphate oxidase